MFLYQVSCLFIRISYFCDFSVHAIPINTRLRSYYHLLFCNYSLFPLLITALSTTPVNYSISCFYLITTLQLPRFLPTGIGLNYLYPPVHPTRISYSYQLLVKGTPCYFLLYQLFVIVLSIIEYYLYNRI